MRLLFELSGEHPELPFAELECIGSVQQRRAQVAVAECRDPGEAERLAFTHVVMEYLGECGPTIDAVKALLKECAIETEVPFRARAKKIHGCSLTVSQLELERLAGSLIHGPVSLKSPEEEYRLICSEDRVYFGRVLMRIDRGSFAYRNPLRRSFFHPGVMMPITARCLANLSLAQPGNLLYDPFCGTGGVLLEAELLGIRVIGSDMDPAMIAGCAQNLPETDLMRADAVSLPLRDGSVDAVVTDLPYGQSVCIRAESMNRLYEDSLAEIRRVLKPGRRGVVVTHQDVTAIAGRHFAITQLHLQRVHKSLTRRIMVLE
jgi:tRNA (guanine10-N2)-dimethyltransferase